MLKRRVAAIAWRVGTGVSAETRLNDQAAASNSSWRSRRDGAIGALEMAG